MLRILCTLVEWISQMNYPRQTDNTRIVKDERDKVVAWDNVELSIVWSVLSQGML